MQRQTSTVMIFFLPAMQVYRDRCVLHFFSEFNVPLVYMGIRTLDSKTGLCSVHVLFKSQVDFYHLFFHTHVFFLTSGKT